MITFKHQGKKFLMEEKFPIEIEYKGNTYLLVITKNDGVMLNKLFKKEIKK